MTRLQRYKGKSRNKRGRGHYDFPQAKCLGELQEGQFYCYVQHKPNTKPFNVGKGHGERYASRGGRNKAYRGTIEKYGDKNIETYIFPVDSEAEAFQYEKELIYMLRCQGFKLVNFTDGGDGVCGRKVSRKTRKKLRDLHKGKIKVKLRAANQAKRDAVIAELNAIVIDTPWGPLGLYDAAAKVGIHVRYFKKRYERGLSPEKLFDPKQGRHDGTKLKGQKRTHEQRKNISKGHADMHAARRNKHVIDTPWGPMGAYDAAMKAGIEWGTFNDRLRKGKTGDKLFSSRTRKNFLQLTNAIVIDTPWGPMGQFDASKKAGIRWITFKERLTAGYSGEMLFRPVRRNKNRRRDLPKN